MNLIKNWRFVLIAVFIIIIAVLIPFLTGKIKAYDFYYPDKDLKALRSEHRTIEIQGMPGESTEEKIIREYMLGPEKYELKLPAGDKIQIKNVWLVTNWKTKTIVINFNSEFSGFVQSNKDNSVWLLRGLIETVKSGTTADKLIIYSDDQPFRKKVGNWNFLYAVPLRYKK